MSGFHARRLDFDEPGRFATNRDRNEAEAIYEHLTGIKPVRPYYQNHDEKTAREILALAGCLADFRNIGRDEERKRLSVKLGEFLMGL